MAAGYSGPPRMSTFFIEGSDIHKDVITTDITQYLGDSASVKSGGHWHQQLGRELLGYYITAYRPPTLDHLQQLKHDSAEWSLELERRASGQGIIPVHALYPGTLRMNSILSENSHSVRDPHSNGFSPQACNTYIHNPISYSQPSPSVQSQSSTVPSVGKNVKDIILMHPQNGSFCTAAALIDPECATGNWISTRIIRKLDADGWVGYGPMLPLQAPGGDEVYSEGDIELKWRLTSTNFCTSTFHVVNVENLDILIANEYQKQMEFHFWQPESSNPLTRYNPAIPRYEAANLGESSDPLGATRRTDELEEIWQAPLEPVAESAAMKLDRENTDFKEPKRTMRASAYSQYT